MAYTRLNVRDLIDKWDAAKVNHLEDGIVANETNFTNFINGNSSSDVYNSLFSSPDMITIPFDYVRELMLDLPRNMGYYGENIHEPYIIYGGDMSGKEIIIAPIQQTSDTMSSEIFSDYMYTYVRVSDKTIPEFVCYSYGGAEEFFSSLAIVESMMNNDAQNASLTLAEMVQQINFSRSMLSNVAIDMGSGYFSLIEQDMDFDFADSEIGREWMNIIFSHRNCNLPEFFTIDHDFEYDGIIFSKGTYVLNVWAYLGRDLCLPLYYINKIWSFADLGGTSDIKYHWDHFDFTEKTLLEFEGNTMKWDGTSSFACNIALVKRISSEPYKFYEGIKNATSFIIKYSDGTQCGAVLEAYNNNHVLRLADDSSSIAVFINYNLFSENSNTRWAPGVYFYYNEDKYISEIVCCNTNVEEFFSHKLPESYYDHLAGRKITLIANASAINSDSYIQNALINFATIDSSIVSGDHRYTKLSSTPIEFQHIATTILKHNKNEPHMHIGAPYDMGNVTASFVPVEGTTNAYTFEGTAIPENGTIGCTIYVDTYQGYNSLSISYKNTSLKGSLRISGVRGPSMPNPSNKVNTTLSILSENNSSHLTTIQYIKKGSWIDIEYTPTEEERGAAIPENFALLVDISSSWNSYYTTIIPYNENWVSSYSKTLVDGVEGLIAQDVNGNNYCVLLNVTKDTTIAGNSCTTGVYGLTREIASNEYSFVHKISFDDYIKLETKKISKKFLPDLPEFNLTEMGLPIVPADGTRVSVNTDAEDLFDTSTKSPVRISLDIENVGIVTTIANFMHSDTGTQAMFSGYYWVEEEPIKFNVVIIIDYTHILAQMIVE